MVLDPDKSECKSASSLWKEKFEYNVD